MNYCLRYRSDLRNMKNVAEIVCELSKVKRVLEVIKDEQRLVVDCSLFNEVEEYDKFKEFYKEILSRHANTTFMFHIDDKNFVKEIKEEGCPVFFRYYCNNYDTLKSLIDFGVTDIYITSELGFNLETISIILHQKGIRSRVYANVAQDGAIGLYNPSIRSFFIRPEDVYLYEGYIDMVEFFGSDDRQDVLYEIYSRESWMGRLKDIIIGIDSDNDVMNDSIPSTFGKLRASCKKKCNLKSQCNLCQENLNLARTLAEHGWAISKN